jgi:hypothetical protein
VTQQLRYNTKEEAERRRVEALSKIYLETLNDLEKEQATIAAAAKLPDVASTVDDGSGDVLKQMARIDEVAQRMRSGLVDAQPYLARIQLLGSVESARTFGNLKAVAERSTFLILEDLLKNFRQYAERVNVRKAIAQNERVISAATTDADRAPLLEKRDQLDKRHAVVMISDFERDLAKLMEGLKARVAREELLTAALMAARRDLGMSGDAEKAFAQVGKDLAEASARQLEPIEKIFNGAGEFARGHFADSSNSDETKPT